MASSLDGAGYKSGNVHWAEPPLRLIPSLGLAFLLSACGTTVDWDYPRTPSTALSEPQTTAIGALFQEPADRHPGRSGFSLVRDGDRGFLGRLAMADLAEKTLDAQYYIWDGDTTGRIMAERTHRLAWAANPILSSTAASRNVCVPPPEAPVAAMRRPSTPGTDCR